MTDRAPFTSQPDDTQSHAASALRLSDVVSALTYALDLTEGQPRGHALRTCVIGMRVAHVLGLDAQTCSDLYYALLLKDLGCSSTAAKIYHLFGADEQRIKRASKTVNFDKLQESARFVLNNAGSAVPWQRRLRHIISMALGRHDTKADIVRVRCERGADIARQMGFSEETATAVRALDEHWNGKGHPYGVSGEAIPLLGRILCLAQTAAIFFQAAGTEAARRVIRERTGTWFDPAVAAAFGRAQRREEFWSELAPAGLERRVAALEPVECRLGTSDEQLDRVAEAFARVIDAKSPWTFEHSERVRQFVLGAAAQLGGSGALSPAGQQRLSRAALLHDIGKLSVPNTILDKEGPLTNAEFDLIRKHPAYSEQILSRVEPFKELAPLAGGHHERMDGRGYHNAVAAGTLDFEVRLLSVADQFEALTAARPYRARLSAEVALEILYKDAGDGVDSEALRALEHFLGTPEAAPLLVPQPLDPDLPISPI